MTRPMLLFSQVRRGVSGAGLAEYGSLAAACAIHRLALNRDEKIQSKTDRHPARLISGGIVGGTKFNRDLIMMIKQ
jgi:hypothetical protein